MVYIKQFFNPFIHQWTLACFHVLAIRSNLQTRDYRSLFEILISVLLYIEPKVELLDYILVLLLTYCGTITLISIVTIPIYIPIKSILGFFFFFYYILSFEENVITA